MMTDPTPIFHDYVTLAPRRLLNEFARREDDEPEPPKSAAKARQRRETSRRLEQRYMH